MKAFAVKEGPAQEGNSLLRTDPRPPLGRGTVTTARPLAPA